MKYVGYNFDIEGDSFLFDEEIDPDSVMELLDCGEDTLFTIHNMNGRLVLRMVYEEDLDPEYNDLFEIPTFPSLKLVV